jgi:hypothetical protein
VLCKVISGLQEFAELCQKTADARQRQQDLRLRCPIVQRETRWYVGNIHCSESNRQELLMVEKF